MNISCKIIKSYLILLLLFTINPAFSLNIKSVDVITDQLDQPWSVAGLPDDQFLVTEKKGNLRLVSATGNVSAPITGLPKISVTGQGGLLDVILHPNFEKNQWIYLSFVAGSGVKGYNTDVVRARLNIDSLKLENLTTIFSALPKTKGGRHFGSRLLFDNKGLLYISLGDRGLRSPSQNLDSHIGSVIRLHDDGSIPKDNPFVDTPNALPEIFSYGHRNIQGLALNMNGEVWAHEHGPQGGDELNHIESGKNYGWPTITYGVNYGIGTKIGEGTEREGMQQPQHVWVPSIAPSGLAFYEDSWLVGALKYQLIVQLKPLENNESTTPKLAPNTHFKEQRFLERRYGRIRDVRIINNAIYLLTDAKSGHLLKLTIQ